MKNYRSNQARLVGCRLVVALTFITAPLIKAAGPIGVDGGWVIDNSGNILLTPAQCSAYTANGVGWLRVNMRLVNGNTTWNSTMLGYYDTAINNAIAAVRHIDGGRSVDGRPILLERQQSREQFGR